MSIRKISVIYEQLACEDVQDFAHRVRASMTENFGEVPTQAVFARVMMGLHPSILLFIPFPMPATLSELFVWWNVASKQLPATDVFWTQNPDAEPEVPNISVTVSEVYNQIVPTNLSICFKCGGSGSQR